MVGAALALALVQRDFSVVLLEPRPPMMQWDAASFDLRVSALTRASQRLLANIGVWDAMAVDRVTAYRQMHVWDRPGLGEIHFDAADLGRSLGRDAVVHVALCQGGMARRVLTEVERLSAFLGGGPGDRQGDAGSAGSTGAAAENA